MQQRPGMKIYNFLVKAFSLGKDYLKHLKKGLEEHVWLQQNYNKYHNVLFRYWNAQKNLMGYFKIIV